MRSVLLLAAALAAMAIADSFAIESCNNGLCGGGCHNQTINYNQCYKINAGAGQAPYVMFNRITSPMQCARAQTFHESSCSTPVNDMNAVCNSCQMGFTFSCGAISGGIFWVNNCTDPLCNNCGGVNIVPAHQCHQVGTGSWGKLTGTSPCNALNANYYNDSSCSSGSMWYNQMYGDGLCVKGTRFYLGSGAGVNAIPADPKVPLMFRRV